MRVVIIEPSGKTRMMDMRTADVVLVKTGEPPIVDRGRTIEQAVVVKSRFGEVGDAAEIVTVIA